MKDEGNPDRSGKMGVWGRPLKRKRQGIIFPAFTFVIQDGCYFTNGVVVGRMTLPKCVFMEIAPTR
jgi:hypothetical protein